VIEPAPKHTPLYDVHLALGARMVAFGGWEMPVWYEGIAAEHEAVRRRVGLFDVSHMGELVLHGRGALVFLRRMLTNDVFELVVDQAQYTLMPNAQGGTVDDLLAYRLSNDVFLLVVNAANIEKDRQWLDEHLPANVNLDDRSEDMALLALQGPLAPAVLAGLTRLPIWTLAHYHFIRGEVAGIQSLVSRTGYTGEDGFEIMCDGAEVEALWQALLEAGATHGIRPAGLGARDSLRLEAALPLYGHELDEETSALEAGLGRFVKLGKPDLMGLARFQREKATGLVRKLVGLRLADRGIPRQGYHILADGRIVGIVTSGTLSPTLGVPIGLGYVPPDLAAVGTALAVQVRGRAVPAEVVARPFYKRQAP
jgi:aminomethyltransferase